MSDILDKSYRRMLIRSDPMILLAECQLSFIFLIHLSLFPCLGVYKRLLTLFCQSPSILTSPEDFTLESKKDEDAVSPFSTSKTRRISSLYLSLLRTLAAQLQALPSEAFTTELPELDVFYLDQLDSLRHNLVKAQSTWDSKTQNDVRYAWEELSDVARKKYRWSIGLLEDDNNVSDEEDEEGEYAPVVVDM